MSNNVTNHEPVHGFKVFNPDWTCRNFQYEVGKTFEEDVNPSCCDRGFHFCEKAADCFNYYKFDSNNKVAEVIAYGEVRTDGDKSCTNKIHIVREIPWMELLTIVNTGKDNTGLGNTGDMNAGISLDAAEELDYDYDNLIRNVSEVIEDMDNETEYGNYDFDGFPVYIGY